jgi:hypothetical protein
MLEPDYSKLMVVGLTPDVAQSHAPLNITVSYAGQDGTSKPFLMIRQRQMLTATTGNPTPAR